MTPNKWLSDKIFSPEHDEEKIKALNEVYSLYHLGLNRDERKIFSKKLSNKRLKNTFHRKLILSIKGL